MDYFNKIINIDCLDGVKQLPNNSINCCITSPPYWGLRDYGVEGQLGLEKTPEEYVDKLIEIFREVKRALRDDGTFWLNLGDSYWSDTLSRKDVVESMWGNRPASDLSDGRKNIPILNKRGGLGTRPNGIKPKDLVGIPWMVAFALRNDGWYLRQDIIWHKPNPMPESVTDRCTKSHEYIFLLSKSPKYYFDYEAIQEEAVWDIDGNGTIKRAERQKDGLKSNPTKQKNGIRILFPNGKNGNTHQSPKTINGLRNKRDVWTINTKPFADAHFATFPEKLIVDMIKAGCPEGGIVLDPFMGAGTTALVARKLNRNYTGFELNAEYIKIAERRLYNELGMFL